MARVSPQEIEQFWREQNPRRQALRKRLDAHRLPYAVAVENLTKDWNLGNLIRTANAFLCGEILLVGGDTFDAAGSGGIHRFERMRHFPDAEAFFAYAREAGYTVIAVEIDERAELLHRCTYPQKPLFLLGSELSGLSRALAERCDARIMVPQYGLIPCLNVIVTCSIVLYDHVTRVFPDLPPAPIRGAKYQIDAESGQKGDR
jgi:tRNA G18 (ribose-2'-O)-methylase SpoU